MQLFHFIWCLRALAGLAIGFVIARKLRDFIRSIVIMCIPLKHRISERSFQIQTRITTSVGIILAIAIAVGLNWGLSKGLARIGITETTTFQNATLTPPVKWTPQPATIPTTIIKPKAETKPFTPLLTPEAETLTAPTLAPTQPTIPKPKKSKPTPAEYNSNYTGTIRPEPTTIYQQRPPYAVPREEISMPYYAQIYAFRDWGKAQQQLHRWQGHQQLPVRVGYMEAERAPYKVVIGPFRNRQAASFFLKQHRIKGFARPAYQLQLFE